MNVRSEHRGSLEIVEGMSANFPQRLAPRGDEQVDLLRGAAVFERGRALEVPARSWKRHQHELHIVPAEPVRKTNERGVGSEVKPSGRNRFPGSANGRSGQSHCVDERLAEVFVVVIAGEGQDGPAIFEELAEDLLPVADCFPQAIRTCQLAEKVACH